MTAIDTPRAQSPAPKITIRRVPFDAPWGWLTAGWRDMWTVPGISLVYGLAFAALSLVLTLGLMQVGMQSLMLALAGGFLLVGPVLAVGLYDTSRMLEAGARPTLSRVLAAGFRAPGQLGFFGAILAFAFFVWVQIAFLLLMLFMGASGLPPPSQFIPMLLFTPRGLGLLVVGTIVGGMLAGVVFAMSAISVPLLMTHRIDAVSAIRASFLAVLRNPKPMLLWAGLIAAFTALGIATLFAGLVIAFPLVGHATWHAYRSLAVDG